MASRSRFRKATLHLRSSQPMSHRSIRSDEAAASVLALMVAANGHIDPREMQTLDALQAFERLGIRRERFLELARRCLDDMGSALCGCSWLRAPAVAFIDALLDRIDDTAQRMLVCRLAAAVITADGCVSGDERMVYSHVLGRWQISQSRVTQAILHDPTR
jgi:tellurite resistance protein